MTASEEALRAVLENLVDNALRYTPAGTTITIAVRREADTAVLEVADDGSGLGLAIVRRVA